MKLHHLLFIQTLFSLPVTTQIITRFASGWLRNIPQKQLMHWASKSWKLSVNSSLLSSPTPYLSSGMCLGMNLLCNNLLCPCGTEKSRENMPLFLSQTNIPFNIIISSLCSVTFLLQITMFTISTVDFSCVFRIWDRTRSVVSNLRQKCQR